MTGHDEATGVVLDEGGFSSGLGLAHSTCPTCGGPATYEPRHDAYACRACNLWLEPVCGEHGCLYCMDRPATPEPAT